MNVIELENAFRADQMVGEFVGHTRLAQLGAHPIGREQDDRAPGLPTCPVAGGRMSPPHAIMSAGLKKIF